MGVKTESTAEEGSVQPGGGNFLAAAHADTNESKKRVVSEFSKVFFRHIYLRS